jgi:hypothetical protein
MTFPRAALPFLLASTVLCTAGLGAPSGAINAVWNYPSNLLSADMSFCIYATNTLAPYPWPLLTNSSAASIEDTNSFDGTNLAFRQPVQIVPGSMFFVVCASNFWGYSMTSNVAATPPLPVQIGPISITRTN